MDIMDLVLKRGRDSPEERPDEYQAPPLRAPTGRDTYALTHLLT